MKISKYDIALLLMGCGIIIIGFIMLYCMIYK
jgi:hypothetical protein